jgi:hypothetical protein
LAAEQVVVAAGGCGRGKLSAAFDDEFAAWLKRYGGQPAAPKKVIESAVLDKAA